MIRVVLPEPLCRMAHLEREVTVELGPTTTTVGAVLDVLENRFPELLGTLRDRQTLRRRPFIRFFVCGEDWSHHPPDVPLPPVILQGQEPLLIIGAMAGG